MKLRGDVPMAIALCVVMLVAPGPCRGQVAVRLPQGVRAVWDMSKAHRQTTATREQICINGLWRWQPAAGSDEVPARGWGYLKVPGAWPGTSGGYMWRETQTSYPHPSWEHRDLSRVDTAWYQREITVPTQWSGRRITVCAEYLNSYAAVFVDSTKMGEIRFPGGEVDITPACRLGAKQMLSLFVAAMPLKAVLLSYKDTGAASRVEGEVARRGLCGDVFLVGTPAGTRIGDVKVEASVRNWEITFDAAIEGGMAGSEYTLRARITDSGRTVKELESNRFAASDLKNGRFAFTRRWKPAKLWDLHTPQNMYECQLSLLDSDGKIVDICQSMRFGFREFWIDGRDFLLNGTRLFCFAVPLDNAQVSAAAASYNGARETMLRLKTLGVNAVYTHNYGCEPGSHLGFEEVLDAADEVGMLVFFSQPHFSHYDWKTPDADDTNGYAQHAEFYVRKAQNHPAVVMYSMSHNATGYSEDMNPDLIDGVHADRDSWSANNAKLALRAEEIVKRFDRTRVIYHHAGGNLGRMHTSNFYLNFVPIQERSDWFEHWATEGVKPLFLCEYGEPWGMNWTLYRGWYLGKRDFGSAQLPWQFCTAEWNAQFLGDRAFRLNEMDRENLRFEARQARAGRLWHRWDYPFPVIGSYSHGYDNKEDVWAMYITDNWRAFRTWGLSGFNAWSYGNFWKLRDGVDKSRKSYKVDWDRLQAPGFSPDFTDSRYERVDTAYEQSDWIPTAAAKALIRNNQPLLAYIAGKPARFTSKDHNFHPGQTVEKQIITINNSRETVTCDCRWLLDLPQSSTGSRRIQVETGQQGRILLRFALPSVLASGEYELAMTAKSDSGQTQEDSFAIHVLPHPTNLSVTSRIALFDPKGETAELLRTMDITAEAVDASDDLSAYDVLIVGKAALTLDGPAPNIGRVRDGLNLLMFEQTSEVLEKRLGFRIQEYGLRRVFPRVPDHPVLAGLRTQHLRDWRGEATILPPRLRYELRPQHGPTVKWCGIEVTRPWRCGCWGNVASVLIEKPTVGDFLPILDGGFSLQYSPLLEYREGDGMILFCQMDVTGRTEDDPAAAQLVANMLRYVSTYTPGPRRSALYAGDPAGLAHFERAVLPLAEYNGEDLTPEQILVVGPGGGQRLAPHRESLTTWLEAGGHLLAIGLDGGETEAFLSNGVTTENAEHIDAYFEPERMDSPLAGVGPADVLTRDPRQLPLIREGARMVGNGVLAVAPGANIVFSQLVPWQFDYEKVFHRKMTYRRTSFLVTRLLANMGTGGATPLLSHFSSPPGAIMDKEHADRSTILYLDKPVEMDDPYRFFRW